MSDGSGRWHDAAARRPLAARAVGRAGNAARFDAGVNAMPVIDVQWVGAPAVAVPPDLAGRIADAVGAVLGLPAGRVWVRLAILPPGHYAENGVADADLPRPVFVTVMHADLPPAGVLAAQARALADAVAVAVACDPALVHIEYAPPGRGRMAFGGRLLT